MSAHRCGMTRAELLAVQAALEWFSDLVKMPTVTGPKLIMRAKCGRLWSRNLRSARAALERELAALVFVDQARRRRVRR